jgi:hypothetical protein
VRGLFVAQSAVVLDGKYAVYCGSLVTHSR